MEQASINIRRALEELGWANAEAERLGDIPMIAAIRIARESLINALRKTIAALDNAKVRA